MLCSVKKLFFETGKQHDLNICAYKFIILMNFCLQTILRKALRLLDKTEEERFKSSNIRGNLNSHIKCGITVAKETLIKLAERTSSNKESETTKKKLVELMAERDKLKKDVEELRKEMRELKSKVEKSSVEAIGASSNAGEETSRTNGTEERDRRNTRSGGETGRKKLVIVIEFRGGVSSHGLKIN